MAATYSRERLVEINTRLKAITARKNELQEAIREYDVLSCEQTRLKEEYERIDKATTNVQVVKVARGASGKDKPVSLADLARQLKASGLSPAELQELLKK